MATGTSRHLVPNGDSSGHRGVEDDVSSSIPACRMIRWHPARVNLPNVWQLFFVFPFLDVVLFGMSRNITCVSCVDVSLQDRDGTVTLHVCTSELREYHVLRGRKSLLESVNCHALARIGATGRGAEGRMFGE
jgi:hypothetical protein